MVLGTFHSYFNFELRAKIQVNGRCVACYATLLPPYFGAITWERF